MRQAEVASAGFLLSLLLGPENGIDVFIRSARLHNPQYRTFHYSLLLAMSGIVANAWLWHKEFSLLPN
jgi:hypothetical protein